MLVVVTAEFPPGNDALGYQSTEIRIRHAYGTIWAAALPPREADRLAIAVPVSPRTCKAEPSTASASCRSGAARCGDRGPGPVNDTGGTGAKIAWSLTATAVITLVCAPITLRLYGKQG